MIKKVKKKTGTVTVKKAAQGNNLNKILESVHRPMTIDSEESDFNKNIKESLIDITVLYPEPLPAWLKGIDLNQCSICDRKNYHIYEVVTLKDKDRFNVVCGQCLADAGYTRRLIKGGWKWISKAGLPVPVR